MIATDFSEQQSLDSSESNESRAIQQINFIANVDRARNTAMFFIIGKAKETVLEFLQGTIKVL